MYSAVTLNHQITGAITVFEQTFKNIDDILKQKEFLEFVLSKHIETGVEGLDQEKLPEF